MLAKAKIRREMASLLKELKIPSKLYRGSKLAFYRQCQNYLKVRLDRLRLSKPGTIVHDCDGFNHVVKGFAVYEYYNKATDRRGFNSFQSELESRKGYIFVLPQLVFEDGRLSCGCDSTPEPPQDRDIIEQQALHWYLNPDPGWPLGAVQIRRKDALLRGEHITDSLGIMLPEYVE